MNVTPHDVWKIHRPGSAAELCIRKSYGICVAVKGLGLELARFVRGGVVLDWDGSWLCQRRRPSSKHQLAHHAYPAHWPPGTCCASGTCGAAFSSSSNLGGVIDGWLDRQFHVPKGLNREYDKLLRTLAKCRLFWLLKKIEAHSLSDKKRVSVSKSLVTTTPLWHMAPFRHVAASARYLEIAVLVLSSARPGDLYLWDAQLPTAEYQ